MKNRRLTNKIKSVYIVMLLALLVAMAGSASEELVLWNKLGSQTEVENSEVGLNGTFNEGGFVEGIFGNAYIADYTQNNGVTFPKEVISVDAGTIEFWAKLIDFPYTLEWGENPSLIKIEDGYNNFGVHLNGNDGAGNGGLCGRAGRVSVGTGGYGSWTYEQVLGSGQVEEWHHYVLVWDENGIPGVYDGTKKVAVFLDGQPNSGRWHGNFETVPLTAGELGLMFNQHLSQGSVAFDELKIWNYAKTDFSAMDVTSTTPTPNAINVAANTNIVVEFSENINPATVDGDTFTVDGSMTGPQTSTFNVSGNTVTFNPDNDFAYGEIVTVTLTTNIQSTGGGTLTSPYTWQFFIGAPAGYANFYDSGQNLGGSVASANVALGDLDGDGDLDAFVANMNNQPNKVWENVAGNFTESQSLGNSYSNDVALGDLNGDGYLDAFVVNYEQPNKVWENDGAGNFTDTGQNLGSSNSYGGVLGDLDGDGDLDAFIANMGQANKVWRNDGAGNFADTGQNLGSSTSPSVALGDVDGDGDLDAFVVNTGGYDNTVWLNDGAGNFADTGQNLGSYRGSSEVALGDIDDDGDLDAFVAAGEFGAYIPNEVYENDGSGSFTVIQTLINEERDYQGVAFGDLDGNGNLDAFVASSGGYDNTVWLNDGTGTFSDSGQRLSDPQSGGVALGDLDGDGDLDAFMANALYTPNKVWLNTESEMDTPTISIYTDKDVYQPEDEMWVYADFSNPTDRFVPAIAALFLISFPRLRPVEILLLPMPPGYEEEGYEFHYEERPPATRPGTYAWLGVLFLRRRGYLDYDIAVWSYNAPPPSLHDTERMRQIAEEYVQGLTLD